MEFLFEVVLQFCGEVLLQLVFELVAEAGFQELADGIKRPKSAFVATVGFLLGGALAGWISLWIFPSSLILNPAFQKANLFVTPLLLGLIMMLVGKIRDRKGQDLVRLDRFGYAFAFAFAMALTRYAGAA